MITIVLQAFAIPAGTTVRKVTEAKTYLIKDEIKVHKAGVSICGNKLTVGEKDVQLFLPVGTRYLMPVEGDDFYAINGDENLAIDLQNVEVAIEFLQQAEEDTEKRLNLNI